MIVYVSHRFGGDKANLDRARKITHDLQIHDLANCYICPLFVFAHLGYCEIRQDDEMELRLDLLQNCDKLLVASDMSESVQTEVDFANLVGMEVIWLDED